MNQRNIIIGAVIAGAVGSLATAFLCSNRRTSFMDTCEDYGDKIKSLVSEFSNFDASELVENIKEHISDLPEMDSKDFIKGVVIGAALAGLVGSGTALLKGKQNGNCFSAFVNSAKNSCSTQDFMDLAQAGIKCWNKFRR